MTRSVGSMAVCSSLVLGLQVAACGAQVSTPERWDADGTRPVHADAECSHEVASPGACSAASLAGYQYAEPPGFWLGDQGDTVLSVQGYGYLVSRADEAGEFVERFSTELGLSVGPDGSLEDEAGNSVLGYSPQQTAGGPCITPLRAPLFALPEPTTRVSLSLNLDPHNVVVTFDVSRASATSNFSTSQPVIDSLGASHFLDLYFVNQGNGLYEYHALVGGGDLVGGVPGNDQEVGSGSLQFSTDGWLVDATTPELRLSFSGGATANQPVQLDFGASIDLGGTPGSSRVTEFATFDELYWLDVDGHGLGTGTRVNVEAFGVVTTEFDSGAPVDIGRLVLARFANEDQLQQNPDGSWRATAGSGPPQFGNARGPGRGGLQWAVEP